MNLDKKPFDIATNMYSFFELNIDIFFFSCHQFKGILSSQQRYTKQPK